LLEKIIGKVEINYDVNLPSKIEDYSDEKVYDDLFPIYTALQKHRGFTTFVKTRKLPRVDFYIPDKKFIVEFDESQHFTIPRELTLSLYPQKSKYGFSVDRWRKLCKDMNMRDNDPPYRDEQRAWYDTLRDFAPVLWGSGKTIRLYSRDFIWCSLNAKNKSDLQTFSNFLANKEDILP